MSWEGKGEAMRVWQMSGRMNWSRNSYRIGIRDRGAISIVEERDRLRDDRAGRWLNKRRNSKPRASSRSPMAFMRSSR